MENETDAFEQGVGAFERGKAREDCPYPPEDERRTLWLEGFDKAKIADDLHVDGLP